MLTGMMLALSMTGQAPTVCPLQPRWRSWQASDETRAHYTAISAGIGGFRWNSVQIPDALVQQYLRTSIFSVDRPLLLDITGMDCPTVARAELMVDEAYSCSPDKCVVYQSLTGERRDYHVRPPAPPPAPATPAPGG